MLQAESRNYLEIEDVGMLYRHILYLRWALKMFRAASGGGSLESTDHYPAGQLRSAIDGGTFWGLTTLSCARNIKAPWA